MKPLIEKYKRQKMGYCIDIDPGKLKNNFNHIIVTKAPK